ncbi:MAG: hypothetical protein KDA24_25655 [Deltaproteobacteria bacterium]|nr:hypothetical protein [Deltaproteobacteria bacterium]
MTRRLLLLLALMLVASPAMAAPSARSITERFDLGGVTERGARWSADELTVLNRTLSALDARERRAIAGVTFVRSPRSPRVRESGLFKWDGEGRFIFVYSRAFDPHESGPNWTLVHEVGHAIAFWPFLAEQRRLKSTIQKYNRAVESYNALISDYNAAATRYNRGRRAADKKALETLRPKVARSGDRVAGMRASAMAAKRGLKSIKRRIKARHPREGVLAAYRKVLGRKRAPTKYGRSNIRESFSDALAMYHCDPRRLKELLPKVHAWLADGGHTRGL